MSSTIPYGYKKSEEDPKQWVIDEPAAKVVRHIFELCLAGLGPTKIARQLEDAQILTPTEYQFRNSMNPSNKRPANPYCWQRSTIVKILENLQYTGCTVNFMSSFVSFKVKKSIEHPREEWQIIPDTQEAIIDVDTFERVQELRCHRRRNTATGRTSLFSGLVYCADCGSATGPEAGRSDGSEASSWPIPPF